MISVAEIERECEAVSAIDHHAHSILPYQPSGRDALRWLLILDCRAPGGGASIAHRAIAEAAARWRAEAWLDPTATSVVARGFLLDNAAAVCGRENAARNAGRL